MSKALFVRLLFILVLSYVHLTLFNTVFHLCYYLGKVSAFLLFLSALIKRIILRIFLVSVVSFSHPLQLIHFTIYEYYIAVAILALF